jgi:hypothetical protein
MEKPGLSVSSKNTSQKMFIGIDEISEIVNDSALDGGNCSELTDNDTCEVNSPFSSSSSSSSEEEEVIQPNLAEAGREHAWPFLNAQLQILS